MLTRKQVSANNSDAEVRKSEKNLSLSYFASGN